MRSRSATLSYLLRKEGFEAAICPAGPMRWTPSNRNGADLVLLDLMLPGPPGTEVCRSLRNGRCAGDHAERQGTPKSTRRPGSSLAPMNYVTKPCSWRELAARIRAVLRRHGETAELPTATLEAARCAWTSRHLATVGGKQI